MEGEEHSETTARFDLTSKNESEHGRHSTGRPLSLLPVSSRSMLAVHSVLTSLCRLPLSGLSSVSPRRLANLFLFITVILGLSQRDVSAGLRVARRAAAAALRRVRSETRAGGQTQGLQGGHVGERDPLHRVAEARQGAPPRIRRKVPVSSLIFDSVSFESIPCGLVELARV